MKPIRYIVHTIEIYGTRPYKIREAVYPCKCCGKDPDVHENADPEEDPPLHYKVHTLKLAE